MLNFDFRSYNEITCCIVPNNTPAIIRYCSKCNKNMEFYCSEKFRLNGNHTRIDIWLIYKCIKCDTTWKLTIAKGIKSHDLTAERFDQFTNNDKGLAWQYAFDRGFLKQQSCVIEYVNVGYSVEGIEIRDQDFPLLIRLKSAYTFDLKLGKFLAGIFGISIGSLRKLVDKRLITTIPECDIMRYKIRVDLDIFVQSAEILI